MKRRCAFTLVELVIVAVIIAIVAVVAVTEDDAVDDERSRGAAERFDADVLYARSASIARPDDPVVVKVDGANNRYWLARQSDPDTPIKHPQSGDDYVVQLDADGSGGVQIVGQDFGGDAVLSFDGQGNTEETGSAFIQFCAGQSKNEVEIPPVAANSIIRDTLTVSLGGGP